MAMLLAWMFFLSWTQHPIIVGSIATVLAALCFKAKVKRAGCFLLTPLALGAWTGGMWVTEYAGSVNDFLMASWGWWSFFAGIAAFLVMLIGVYAAALGFIAALVVSALSILGTD